MFELVISSLIVITIAIASGIWIKYSLSWQGYQTAYQWYYQDYRRNQFRFYLNLHPKLIAVGYYDLYGRFIQTSKTSQNLLADWYSHPISELEYNQLVKNSWRFLRTIDPLERPFSIQQQVPTLKMRANLAWWQTIVLTQNVWAGILKCWQTLWLRIRRFLNVYGYLINPRFYFYLGYWYLLRLFDTADLNRISTYLSQWVQQLQYDVEGELLYSQCF